jgi:branched-chain amino acid transport system ATP-binding protein
MSERTLLEVENLTVAYGSRMVVENVRLTVDKGEVVGLCGPNKAGKSTLCGALAGIVPIARGIVRFAGDDITNARAHDRLQRGIALCPEGRGIYAELSVLDNLRIAGDTLPAAERARRVDEAIAVFSRLGDRLHQRAGTLSGGEAQMLGIARRLMNRPRLLIVDEPSLGLAPKAIRLVFDTLTGLRDEFGTAVLLVEEGLARIKSKVDRAHIMSMGQIVAGGTTDELARNPLVARAYAGEESAQGTTDSGI